MSWVLSHILFLWHWNLVTQKKLWKQNYTQKHEAVFIKLVMTSRYSLLMLHDIYKVGNKNITDLLKTAWICALVTYLFSVTLYSCYFCIRSVQLFKQAIPIYLPYLFILLYWPNSTVRHMLLNKNKQKHSITLHQRQEFWQGTSANSRFWLHNSGA